MHAQILTFPSFTEAERHAMTRPPDEKAVEMATNLLIAALWNYSQTTTGESDQIVSYLDVPPVKRECFYRNWAVPAAVAAVWGEDE